MAQDEFCASCFRESDVFVMRSNGSHLSQLTDDSLNAVRPGWSPEGDRIQVGQSCSDFSDPACFYFDIYTLDLDGGSVRNITATSDIGEGGAHWGAKATTDD